MNTVQRLKSILNLVLIPLIIFSLALAPVMVGAVTPVQDTRSIGAIPDGAGVFQSTDLIGTISLVIRWALSFIGIFVFIIFLYAGFEYATSGGNNDKAKEATTRMVNAIIGLIIIFFAFVASNAILSFIFQQQI